MTINVDRTGVTQLSNGDTTALEAGKLAIQSSRANLLESQLIAQMNVVQEKNKQISNLDAALNELEAVAGKFNAEDQADKKVKDVGLGGGNAFEKQVNDMLIKAGITTMFAGFGQASTGGTQAGLINESVSKGQVSDAIQRVKSEIDKMSHGQQMDLLRLQSLSDKRNESFVVMTHSVTTMQENRSSIIGNMR